MPVSAVATVAYAVARGGGDGSALRWASAGLVLLSVITTLAVNVPINAATSRWDPEHPPPDWRTAAVGAVPRNPNGAVAAGVHPDLPGNQPRRLRHDALNRPVVRPNAPPLAEEARATRRRFPCDTNALRRSRSEMIKAPTSDTDLLRSRASCEYAEPARTRAQIIWARTSSRRSVAIAPERPSGARLRSGTRVAERPERRARPACRHPAWR
jgi:hypothetical protein